MILLPLLCSCSGTIQQSGGVDPVPPAVTVFYASPSGTGSNCTQASPCNITRVQDKVRAALAAQSPAGSSGVTVMLAGGIYRLSAPLTFTAADSGSAGKPVRWQAVSGARPVISGAIQVADWIQTDPANGIWSASLPSAILSRDLYVNGRPVPVAQVNVSTLGFNSNWVGSDSGYDISGDSAAQSYFDQLAATIGPGNLTTLQFVYTGKNGGWTQSSCPVQSISVPTIALQQPCWYNLIHRPSWNNASGPLFSMAVNTVPTVIENAYPLLRPGQWFLNAGSRRLYYVPLPGEQMSNLDVELPRLEVLLSGSGAHDLAFTGITFTGSTWNDATGPSSSFGFSDVQSNLRIVQTIAQQQTRPQGLCTAAQTPLPGSCPFGSWTPPPASVQFTSAANLSLTGNVFTCLGVAALGIYGGSTATVVQGNVFSYIASSAIEIGSPLDAPASQSQMLQHTTVSNNLIHHIGTGYPSAPAITIFYSRNSTISNNEIFHVPYDGISSGVTGGHDNTPSIPDLSTNINANNSIANNLIHNFMEELNDGGAIYMEGHQGQSWSTALTVSGNVSYANTGYGYTYFTDAGAEWINLDGNAVWDYNGQWAIGGCAPIGHIHTSGNYSSSNLQVGAYACINGQVDTQNANNTAISILPGPAELPASLLGDAGLQGAFRSLASSLPPEIDYTGTTPASGSSPAEVLIAGEGFSSQSQVSIGGAAAGSVSVLSPGFITATVPSLAGGTAFPLELTVSGSNGSTDSILEANAIGIFTDGLVSSSMGFDGDCCAYSATLLGTSLSWSGATFPLGPANAPDAVRGMGQAIILPAGHFVRLLMLGAAVNGNQAAQPFTLTYTDGTSAQFTQSLSDWYTPSNFAGETIVQAMPYRNINNGTRDSFSSSNLYGYTFPLDSSKTTASLTLPQNANVVLLGIVVTN